MSLIIEYLNIDHPLQDGVSGEVIEAFFQEEVLPEINSINEQEPSFYASVPNQSKDGEFVKDAYFDCSAAFDIFYESPATINDLKHYTISGDAIHWCAESENGTCNLTRYLAWKVFCKFGVGETFFSKVANEDMCGVSTDISIVGRNGLETYI
jgi:hypothetical protein